MKLDSQLKNSLQKESELVEAVKKIEAKEGIRRTIRDVEREELEKINRLLI